MLLLLLLLLLQVTNSIYKRETVTYSEIYEGTNFRMDMTTASVPVYDKTDPNRWKMWVVAVVVVIVLVIVKVIVVVMVIIVGAAGKIGIIEVWSRE